MRKGLIGCLAIMTVLLFLSACAGKEHVGEQTERQEIVIWSYYETDAQIGALDMLVKSFNESQETYTASWEYVPMSEFEKKISIAYTEQSLPDVVIIDNPDMNDFIRIGMFEDITDDIKEWNMEEYYSCILETVCVNERYYGIPFNCNNVVLVYNKKMLEQASMEPPKTWEELYDAATCLTSESCKGFLMCGLNGEQGAFQMLPWILSAGEELDSIGAQDTLEAFQFIDAMLEAGCLSGDCINLSQNDLARKFIAGEVAMIENGPWIFPMLEEAGISYGITALPYSETPCSVVGGENLAIVRGKNREGALAFIEFCMSETILEAFCEQACVLPTRRDVARKVVEKNPQLQVVEEQMETAVARNAIEGWSGVSNQLTEALRKMVGGEWTPEQATESLKSGQK